MRWAFEFRMELLLFTLLVLGLTNCPIHCKEKFEPVTENISFKVTYEVQAFVNGDASLLTEVQEQYQHNLASANIEQINYDGKTRLVSRKFIFNGESRRIIEVANYTKYASIGTSSKKPIILSEARQTFESELLKLPYTDVMAQLNFDSFLTSDCLEKINKKLFYIKGITKLLHLIECRREELNALNYGSQSVEQDKLAYTRNLKSRIYTSDKPLLPLRSRVDDFSINSLSSDTKKSMQISVNIPYDAVSFSGSKENYLPSRIVPLSISLQFEQGILMIINIYQFDVIDLMEHMSETSSGVVSDFLIPIGSGLSDVLFYSSSSFNDNQIGKSSRRPKSVLKKTQFSFRASLTGNNLPFPDPVELLVAYDGENKMLVREIITTDRGVSLGDGWKTHKSRLVYDGESNTKFHIKNSNEDYTKNNIETDDNQRVSNAWQSCVTNSLNSIETYILDGSSASSDLFDLEGSTYMGIAEVRGIPCYVYEKRVFRLPLWLGLGETEYSYLNDPTTIAEENEIYLAFYESISDYVGVSYEDEEIERNRDSSTQNIYSTSHSKLVRLDIHVVKNKASNGGERLQLLNYILEMHSFDWSIGLVHDELELFDVSQECLLPNINSRSMKLDLLIDMAIDEDNTRGYLLLKEDSSLCQDTVSRALSKSLSITKTEQVALETNIQSGSLHTSLYVYEIPCQGFISKFMGFAQDLLLGSAASNSWESGTTSISLDECEWRAAHTLEPFKLASLTNNGDIHSDRDDDYKSSRLFMYCPKTLHCVLGDLSWNLIHQQKPFSNRQIKYPSENPNKCIVMAISAVSQYVNRHRDLRGRTLIEWLATRGEEDLIGTPLDLKVDGLSIAAKITRFKVSQVADRSLEPITGVGYEKLPNIEPLIVSNMAHCSHTCLMLHNCASYSVCHHQEAHLECIFTTIDWTEPAKVNELKKQLVGTSGLPILIDVQLADSSMFPVSLKRSSLCTIYGQEHFDVFRFKESSLVRVISPEYLLHSGSIKDCAKFCLERGNFFHNMSQSSPMNKRFILKGSRREFACTSFMFDKHLKTCELKPNFELQTKKILEYIELQISKHQSTDSRDLERVLSASKWQESLLKLRERVDSLPAFSDIEIYELNYAQLFEVDPDKRLTDLANKNELSPSSALLYNELQLTILDTGVENCAKLCLSREGCRSFDIYTDHQAGGEKISMMKKSNCVLNAYSLNDISNIINQHDNSEDLKLPLEFQAKKSIEGEQNAGGDDNSSSWYHYEPGELALYLIGDVFRSSPDARIVPTTSNNQQQQQQQSRILINNAQTTIYILPLVIATTAFDVPNSSSHGSQQIALYDNGKINYVNGIDSASPDIAMAVLFYAAIVIAITLIVSINLYLCLFDRGSTGWKRLFTCHYCNAFFANISTLPSCNRC